MALIFQNHGRDVGLGVKGTVSIVVSKYENQFLAGTYTLLKRTNLGAKINSALELYTWDHLLTQARGFEQPRVNLRHTSTER